MMKDFASLGARFAVVFFAACMVLTQAANAQSTIHVPADQSTIQAAINAASNGDTVLVAPGTYVENLNFNGKAITVTSSDGPAVTIIDGNAAGPVAIFNTNEGTDSVLNGFTLQNGVPSQIFPVTGTEGGGILILNTSPTITSNVITGNHAICGIGIEIRGGSAVVRGNTITGNTQAGGSGGCGGGGIEITGDSFHPPAAPLITGNTITNNSLLAGGFGGGIGVSFFASPIIQNNYIAGNAVWNSGGGIQLQSSLSPVVVQNIIVNNSVSAGGSGGGIYVQGPSSAADVIVNNTIRGNTAVDGSSGIFTDVHSPVAISNNIVVAASGQTAIVCSPFSSAFPAFSHNDVTSPGGGQAWSSNCAANALTNGNISADPLFVDAINGDYHLQVTSPAIDAGDNGAPNLPQQEYDGKTRVVDGNNDCVDTVDLGAYELQATAQAGFSPASLTFTNQVLNTTSSAQAVTLSSTGTGCLKLTGLTVTGDFTQSSTCGGSLPAGQSCVVNVTFTPTATGTRTGTLALAGNQGGAAPSVSLSGTGINPANASVSPAAIDFGNQAVGTDSPAQTVTVSNTGGATLHINSIAVTGDPDFFILTSNCVGGPGVAPGGSCSIQVEFQPKSAGAGSATLTITGDAVNSPVSVSLSGTGAVPNPVFSAAALAFGNVRVGTTATQAITLTNSSTVSFSNNGLAISGVIFFTQTNNCPATLGPGQSCTINVSFSPTSRGTFTGTLNVFPAQPMSTPSVALSGTGVAPVAVLTQNLSFAPQVVGTTTSQAATLSNAGDAPLIIANVATTGDFAQSNACGTSLAPGAFCSIIVSFTPAAAGARSGTLTVTDDDLVAAQQTTALSGTGLDYALSASPASISTRVGHPAKTTVIVSALGGSFPNAVALSCSSLPAGSSCSFSPASVTPGATSASSTLTVNTQSGGVKTARGTYSITVNGTSGGLVRTTVATLTIQ